MARRFTIPLLLDIVVEEYTVETPAGPVTDVIRQSPVDREQHRCRRRLTVRLRAIQDAAGDFRRGDFDQVSFD